MQTKRWILTFVLVLGSILVVVATPLLYQWQQVGEQKARSLSNLRRLSDSWQLYAQDWDGYPVPPVERRPDGNWLTWQQRLGGYGVSEYLFENPSNQTGTRRHDRYLPNHLPTDGLHDPKRGFAVETSYALNSRFWNTFAPGPFPAENLELPAQTVLFIEAGPMSPDPLRAPHDRKESGDLALIEYGDTLDRLSGRYCYPSTHDGKMALVAADGHAPSLRVEHYLPSDGPHHPLYGRIGADIYNWNGGHPNGELDQPPHE